jgi:hypothetical protein
MPASLSYIAGPVPENPKEIPRYLREELAKIAGAVSNLAAGHIDTSYAAPPRPREGDIRLADGTHWDPVSAGAPRFVGYRDGAWAELG